MRIKGKQQLARVLRTAYIADAQAQQSMISLSAPNSEAEDSESDQPESNQPAQARAAAPGPSVAAEESQSAVGGKRMRSPDAALVSCCPKDLFAGWSGVLARLF